MLTICWPGKVIGRGRIQPWSFRNAMMLPVNETAPMRPPTTAREPVVACGCAEERDCRDPGRRTATHTIVERYHLGHVGHRDTLCRDVAEAPADDDRDRDQGEVGEVWGKERDERRDQHRGTGPDNPAPGSERVAHPLHADDEEEDRHDVDRLDSQGEVDHLTPPCRASSRCGRTSGGSAP